MTWRPNPQPACTEPCCTGDLKRPVDLALAAGHITNYPELHEAHLVKDAGENRLLCSCGTWKGRNLVDTEGHREHVSNTEPEGAHR